MKKTFFILFYCLYLFGSENKTHFLQNPPPAPKKQEFDIFKNASIKEIDIKERIDAYFKCKKADEKNCDDYIKNRYFDIDADINSNFGLHVR